MASKAAHLFKMQLSWCLEEKLARSTSFWRHKRSVRRHINPAIWDIIAIWDSVLKGCSEHTSTKGKLGGEEGQLCSWSKGIMYMCSHPNPQAQHCVLVGQLKKLKSRSKEHCCELNEKGQPFFTSMYISYNLFLEENI